LAEEGGRPIVSPLSHRQCHFFVPAFLSTKYHLAWCPAPQFGGGPSRLPDDARVTREGFAGVTAPGRGAGMRGASKARLSACAITASLSAGWAAPSSSAATSSAGAAHPAAPAEVPAATQSRGQLAPSNQIDGFAAAG